MKKPYALITRPLEDAKITAQQLAAMGIDSFIEPLLVVENIVASCQLPVSGILITSSNAVRSLSKIDKAIPIIAVGEHTAAVAKEFGFTFVEHADGDVDNLVEYVTAKYKPYDKFIYACGNVTTGNLTEKLKRSNFDIEEVIVYNASAIENFSSECLSSLKQKAFGIVLLYSPRTAKIFTHLIKKGKLEASLNNTQVFCLSQNVAEQVKLLEWKKVNTSLFPNNYYLLELIREFGLN
ncbi:MAG: putative uroporphyrinogen-III synthase [Rickettsiaceae bacterium]|jgi:uroporphyrinogen-III synthase|nr:putative uroporphyrinogen-III synthase [Rickettsiaceae bacterium]